MSSLSGLKLESGGLSTSKKRQFERGVAAFVGAVLRDTNSSTPLQLQAWTLQPYPSSLAHPNLAQPYSAGMDAAAVPLLRGREGHVLLARPRALQPIVLVSHYLDCAREVDDN